MPPKSRIVSSCRLSLLAAAATVLFAGQAEAGNKPTQPLTPAACIAAGIKPPAGFFSWGTGFVPPPKVEFDFLIGAGKPELCPLIKLKVTWLYHITDKKTLTTVKTVSGKDTFPLILQQQWQHLTLDCTPTVSTYCKDASATILPGSNYVIITGKGNASVGPLKP